MNALGPTVRFFAANSVFANDTSRRLARRGTFCAKIGVATALSLLVAGCATSVPDVREAAEVEAPAEWTALATGEYVGASLSDSWIRQIGGRPLEELVEEALRNNRNLAATAARVEQSAAQARLAGAERWPELRASFSASRAKSVIPNPLPPEAAEAGGPALPDLLESQATRFDLAAEASWEADLWGRLSDGARAAVAEYEAVEADFKGARLALAGEVARRWLEYSETAQQLELAERTEENFRTYERVLSRRFDAGLSSALDVRLARTSTRSAAEAAAARRQQLDALARSLETLLGRYPDRSVATTGWLDYPPPPIPGIPGELLARRPDLQAAEARYAAAALQRGASRKLRYPSLTLSASAGTASTELSDVLNSDFGVWSLVGGLTAPIFAAGRISSQIDAAEAGELAALEDFASALLDAYREVETGLAAERLLAEREARILELAEETTAAEEQAWDQYERGLIEIATVLEAQRRAFDSASQVIAIQAQRRLNRVTLHLALGGDIPETATAEASDTFHDP